MKKCSSLQQSCQIRVLKDGNFFTHKMNADNTNKADKTISKTTMSGQRCPKQAMSKQ